MRVGTDAALAGLQELDPFAWDAALDEPLAIRLGVLAHFALRRVGGLRQNRPMPSVPTQPRNPLHGLTLEAIVTALVAHYGWPGLAERVPLRCFSSEPSMTSSLKVLRKTPWAREKVESLYLFMLRGLRRGG